MMRILIAGVGNVLRGDDGFGIAVLRLLRENSDLPGVEFFESGIAGISLVQQLMDGYDALVIIDALDRKAEPGRVFVLEPERQSLVRRDAFPRVQGRAEAGPSGISEEAIPDLHQADPEAVLRMAAALKILPERVWIVGCQAVGCDDLGVPFSEPVARAVPIVVDRVREIIDNLTAATACHVTG